MTRLRIGDSVTRETMAMVRDRGERRVIATINATHLVLRAKGLRDIVAFPLADLYVKAIAKQHGVEPCANPRKRLGCMA